MLFHIVVHPEEDAPKQAETDKVSTVRAIIAFTHVTNLFRRCFFHSTREPQ